MRRHVVGAVALVAALALAGAAAAKGPSSASITGPQLERSLAVAGQGEGPGTALGNLVDLGGFFPQMYGQSPDPTLRARPSATLGPRYVVTYVVPGPNSIRSKVVQSVYPVARPVPLTFMQPGQTFWNGRKTHGGWFRATAELRTLLAAVGVHR